MAEGDLDVVTKHREGVCVVDLVDAVVAKGGTKSWKKLAL